MTQQELYECMNLYIVMWKSAIQGTEHRDGKIREWIERGFLNLDKELFKKALYEYEDTNEKNYVAPRTRQILDAYDVVKKRLQGKGNRRIETPDEVMYGIYLKEMKKPVDKRNEWLIEQCLPACEVMTNEEAYIRKYGKPREEFERY